MNTKNRIRQPHKKLSLMLTVLAVSVLAFPSASREQTTKFYGVGTIVLTKACGNGLDQDSGCGTCFAPFTKAASCGHACVRLPDRLASTSVVVVPSGAEGSNPTTSGYKKCGKGNVNDPCVGWDRFEQTEWYADTHMICGRFKNWSADRDRVYSFQVWEK